MDDSGWNPAEKQGYQERAGPSRRRFLDYLLGTSAVATLGAIVYPIFKFGNKPGIIVRTSAGELKALSAVCTHLECIVQYRSDTKQIWCACHNGQYNLSGKNIGGPPPRPLEEFKVNTRGDDIVVSRS